MRPPKPALGDLNVITLRNGQHVRLTQAQLDWVWERISLGEDGCWLWMGSRLPAGYGKAKLAVGELYAHRLTYMLFVGDIERGLHTDHLCRNPPCCNPAHLEPVTCQENVRRSPIAPAGINAAKTHCKRGHPLAGLNLAVRPDGSRWCRTCASARFQEDAADGSVPDLKPLAPFAPRRGRGADACVKGHPLDLANTYVDPKGLRHCRACRAAAKDRYQRKKKGKP